MHPTFVTTSVILLMSTATRMAPFPWMRAVDRRTPINLMIASKAALEIAVPITMVRSPRAANAEVVTLVVETKVLDEMGRFPSVRDLAPSLFFVPALCHRRSLPVLAVAYAVASCYGIAVRGNGNWIDYLGFEKTASTTVVDRYTMRSRIHHMNGKCLGNHATIAMRHYGRHPRTE